MRDMLDKPFKIFLTLVLLTFLWIAWGAASNGRYLYHSATGSGEQYSSLVLDTRTGTILGLFPDIKNGSGTLSLEIHPQSGEVKPHFPWTR